MAAGRTFRPGPWAEYKQKPLRFDDDSLNTVEIPSPLDVAYAPGGVHWRQNNQAAIHCRPPLRAEYRQKPLRFDDDTLSTAAIDATPPLDVAYGVGGTRWRQTNQAALRRPASEGYYQRRPFNALSGIPDVTGTVAATQDDDVAAITGTFTDPAYGDGGIRAKQASSVYRRLASRLPYLRRLLPVPPETYTGTIAVTQDDDVAAITGTFTDPAYGDGGVRARAQSSVYRRLVSRVPYIRHLISVPPDFYTAVVAATQDDDVAAITGQGDDPYTGDSPTRARAGSSVYRRLASRLTFTRRLNALPQDTTVVGSVIATQDDDVAAISGTFTDPPYLSDGGIRARQNAPAYRRPASEGYYQRRTFTVAITPVTGTIAATQDDDIAAITGQADIPYAGDGGIRARHLLAQGHRPRALYCQRRYTDFVGTAPTISVPGPPIYGQDPRVIDGADPRTITARDPAVLDGADPRPVYGRNPTPQGG